MTYISSMTTNYLLVQSLESSWFAERNALWAKVSPPGIPFPDLLFGTPSKKNKNHIFLILMVELCFKACLVLSL